ncbi:transglycosylase SLT domain-containing protein [Erythrobacter sp. EC-HK427]|uniref:transglycosylase SLT domain-containing protein n=1 Tax=Erythrobacter sp. EC-HK427 TaxID=2038396 RepID=UPI001258D113|nr:transglycosylase SLT domain-containing protein [Erythrobacter sp. EC-HK427]VVT01513.1 Lytic transglycosylase, catalytic [Erythrobacter sp. EC-HK427]
MVDPFTNAGITPAARVATPVEQAIAAAANRTGVDFGYLLAQAQIESAMDPEAEARTSTASGLFQFIEQTWLDTLYRHGSAHGYGTYADAIGMRGGRAFVRDPAMRETIMDLRFDPQASSIMAGALASDNRAALLPVLGREPDASELYLAHFLGQGGATRFLRSLQSSPDARADSILPAAARANRPIFYERDGSARTVAEVAQFLRNKVETAMQNAAPGELPDFLQIAAATDAQGYAGGTPPPFTGFGMPGQPLAATATTRPSMAETLSASFGLADGSSALSPRAAGHVRHAYAQLRVFGL